MDPPPPPLKPKRAPKTAAQKKPPQRGMGVAQLERLRVQEKLKKITETYHHHTNTFTKDSNNSPPFLYNHPPFAHIFPCACGSTASHHHHHRPAMASESDQHPLPMNSTLECWKELSSIPNVINSKKRMKSSGGGESGDFLGLSIGYSSRFCDDDDSFTVQAPVIMNLLHEALEVKGEGRGVVMEYEFLGSSRSCSEKKVGREEEQACLSMIMAGGISEPVDLSLKL